MDLAHLILNDLMVHACIHNNLGEIGVEAWVGSED